MKIFLALKQIEFVLKMFAAAGFTNFAKAFEAKDENALKTHIESLQKIEKVVEKVVEPTDEQITSLLTAELREQIIAAGFTLAADADPMAALKLGLSNHAQLNAQLQTLTAEKNLLSEQLGAIRAAKIEFAADAKPAAIAAAIESRISMRAGEELAKRGIRDFPEQNVNADPSKPNKPATNLTGLARTQAAFEAKQSRN